MSANLDQVMKTKGIVCAIEFDKDGHPLASKGDVSEEIVDVLADLFSANMRMAKMEAHLFSVESGLNGFSDELTGFAMFGNELAMCVIENVGVVVNSAEADLNQIYETLATA